MLIPYEKWNERFVYITINLMMLPLLIITLYAILFNLPKMSNSNSIFDNVFYLKEFKKKHSIISNKYL